MTEIETAEVPKEALIHFAHELAMECDDHEIHMPYPDMDTEEFYKSFRNKPHSNDIEVEVVGEEQVSIRGTVLVREVVGYKRATRWQPEEYEFTEREMMYDIQLSFDGLGYAKLRAETW